MGKVEFIEQFKSKYSIGDVIHYLNRLENLNVLCMGEMIMDVYQFGYTLGKAGKAPIVAFQNEKREMYNGGIFVIADHLKDFVNVTYYTIDKGVTKTRYIEGNQKLFETYSSMESEWETLNFNSIPDYDMVLIADFGHGMFTKELRKDIQDKAKYIALNVQHNAGNLGFNTINKYERGDYICIDQYELRLALSNQYDRIEDIVKDTFEDDITVAITLSSDGCLIYKDKKVCIVPAFAENIVDTIGAGDAFLAITSPLAYINAPAEVIGFIGNCAGAVACSWQGNKYHLTRKKLIEYIKEVMK